MVRSRYLFALAAAALVVAMPMTVALIAPEAVPLGLLQAPALAFATMIAIAAIAPRVTTWIRHHHHLIAPTPRVYRPAH